MAILDVLKETVQACGELIMSLRGASQAFVYKDRQLSQHFGQHFFTAADQESLKLGFSILGRAMPEEVIIAEEQENASEVPSDCTVFDPLDGTTNFFNGLDEFGVTACTLRDGQPVSAATYFPIRKMLIFAERGVGCWSLIPGHLISMPVKIHWHGMMDKAQIGAEVGSWLHEQQIFDPVLKPLSRHFNILSCMAAIEGGRRVLLGQAGAYFNFGIARIWDAAGMALAIQEAGGIVCDPYGNPLQWKSICCDWVFAVDQQIADVVLQYTRQWPGRRKSWES